MRTSRYNTDSSLDEIVIVNDNKSIEIEHLSNPHSNIAQDESVITSQLSCEIFPQRFLNIINIPCDFRGLLSSVYASDDGHFINFSGNSFISSFFNEALINKSNLEISGIHSIDKKHEVVKIDLSKLEQRIASQEGALGIALVVAFVAVTFNNSFDSIINRVKGIDGENTNDSAINNFINSHRTHSDSPNISTDMINHNIDKSKTQLCRSHDVSTVRTIQLNSLLNRFDALYGSWQSGYDLKSYEIEDPLETLIDDKIHKSCMKVDNWDSFNLHNNQLNIDKIILSIIHKEFLGSNDFIWPRKFEAAGAINRLRGVKFTTF
jgi:hypothetical protein